MPPEPGNLVLFHSSPIGNLPLRSRKGQRRQAILQSLVQGAGCAVGEAEGSPSGLVLPRQRCTQAPGYALSSASSFSPTRPPLFCTSWQKNPPPHTPSSWAVSGLWTRERGGLPGPTPRLTLTGSRERPRIVIPWAQSHSVLTRSFLLCLSPRGRSWGQGRGGAHTWREACAARGTQSTRAHGPHTLYGGSLGCSSFSARRPGE